MAFAPMAIQMLWDLAKDAESEPVRAKVLIDLLDRAGLKVAEEHVLVPAEQTNASLDAAIANALGSRGLLPEPVELEPGSQDSELPDTGELVYDAVPVTRADELDS